MIQQDNDTEPTGQTASSDRSDRPKSTGQTASSDQLDWSDRDKANDMCEAIEDLGDLDKLGQGFTSADPLKR